MDFIWISLQNMLAAKIDCITFWFNLFFCCIIADLNSCSTPCLSGSIAGPIITNLLRYSTAHSLGYLLMHSLALLLGNILTCLVWYLCTGLFCYCPALLGGNIIAHLSWYIFTVIVGHLLQPLLLHVLALVVSIVLAGPLDRRPHLVVPRPLPLVLTVLLVVCTAVSLCVVLCLISVLLAAHLFILCVAHCLVHSLTLLPLLGYALLLVLCAALLDLHSLALLCLCLHILCVPHLCILCPTRDLWTTLYRSWSFHWLRDSSSILGSTMDHREEG